MEKTDYIQNAILAINLKGLMQTKAGPNSEIALGKRAKVGQATIGRILKRDGFAKIDTVGKLAQVYGLEAWQLMVPGMDPSNPPVLLPVSKAEKALYARLKDAVDEITKLKGEDK